MILIILTFLLLTVGTAPLQGELSAPKSTQDLTAAVEYGSLDAEVSLMVPRVTVFVHGTVLPYLAFYSPQWFLYGDVGEDSKYAARLRQGRENPILCETTPMTTPGLYPILSEDVEAVLRKTLETNKTNEAAYYVVASYDAIKRMIDDGVNRDYKLFGWSGMNSQSGRKKSAEEFYDALVTMRDEYYQQYGVYPEIELICHSHGGNVALWLAHIEEQRADELRINRLILCGTPMQAETAAYIASPVFTSIMSFWSSGDKVQTIDSYSTQAGESFKMMNHVIDVRGVTQKTSLKRYDIQLRYNGDSKYIDHLSLFSLRSFSGDDITPLPWVVILPLLVEQIEQNDELLVVGHIVMDNQTLTTCALPLKRARFTNHCLWATNVYGIYKDLYEAIDDQWNSSFRDINETWRHFHETHKAIFSMAETEVEEAEAEAE